MSNLPRQLSQSHDVSAKVAQLLLQTRTRLALARFNERAQQAREQIAGSTTNPTLLSELWAGGARYGVDFAQRSILPWDTLRQRGNKYLLLGIGAVVILQLQFTYAPTLQRLFDTDAVALHVWPWLFAGGFVFIVVVEMEKLIIRSSPSLRDAVTAVEAGT
jgi:magnesium-transporting ATPase (P-type)